MIDIYFKNKNQIKILLEYLEENNIKLNYNKQTSSQIAIVLQKNINNLNIGNKDIILTTNKFLDTKNLVICKDNYEIIDRLSNFNLVSKDDFLDYEAIRLLEFKPTKHIFKAHFIFEPIVFKELPDVWKNNLANFKRYNPTANILIWNLKDGYELVCSSYPEYESLFSYLVTNKWICAIDLLRYLILHKYGGLYLDFDIEHFGSFSGLIDKYESKLIVTKESDFGFKNQVNNCLIYSKPNNPIFLKLVTSMTNTIPKMTMKDVLEYSGPILLSRILETNLIDIDLTRKIYDKEYVILPKVYSSSSKYTHHRIFNHTLAGSWLEKDMYNYTYTYSYV